MIDKEIIRSIESAWEAPNGLFYRLRQGEYDPISSTHIVHILSQIDIDKEEFVEKRLIALLWYIPVFLEWQTNRIAENGGNIQAYTQFKAKIQNCLEKILGLP